MQKIDGSLSVLNPVFFTEFIRSPIDVVPGNGNVS